MSRKEFNKAVTVLISGIPAHVSLNKFACHLDKLFDTDEIGSFRVHDAAKRSRKRNWSVAVDFKSGFDAMFAQELLDGYIYEESNCEEYKLRAQMSADSNKLLSRSPSPGPSNRHRSSDSTIAGRGFEADEEVHRASPRRHASLELQNKHKLVRETEKALYKAKKQLEKESKRKYEEDSDTDSREYNHRKKHKRKSPSKSRRYSNSEHEDRSRQRYSHTRSRQHYTSPKERSTSRSFSQSPAKRSQWSQRWHSEEENDRAQNNDQQKQMCNIQEVAQEIVAEMKHDIGKYIKKTKHELTKECVEDIVEELKRIICRRLKRMDINEYMSVGHVIKFYYSEYSKSYDQQLIASLVNQQILMATKHRNDVEESTGDSKIQDITDDTKIWRAVDELLFDIKMETITSEETETSTHVKTENNEGQASDQHNTEIDNCPKQNLYPNPIFYVPVKKLMRQMRSFTKDLDNSVCDKIYPVYKEMLRSRLKEMLKGMPHMKANAVVTLYRNKYPKTADGEFIEKLKNSLDEESNTGPNPDTTSKGSERSDGTNNTDATLKNNQKNNYVKAGVLYNVFKSLLPYIADRSDVKTKFIEIVKNIVNRRVDDILNEGTTRYRDVLERYNELYPENNNMELGKIIIQYIEMTGENTNGGSLEVFTENATGLEKVILEEVVKSGNLVCVKQEADANVFDIDAKLPIDDPASIIMIQNTIDEMEKITDVQIKIEPAEVNISDD